MAKVALAQRHLRVVPGHGTFGQQDPPTDDELIDAFERGDKSTAALLFERLDGVVGATLVRVLGRRQEDHDDLVQAAFEQILRTLARGKFARACRLSSWAVAVTTNVALSALRRRCRERRHLDLGSEAELSESPNAAPDQRAMLDALRRQLAELSPRTAEVVILHDMAGHDLAEIAVLTGLSVAAAQSRLVRGRAALRSGLRSLPPGAGS